MNPNPATASALSSAEALNRDCFCRTLNLARLREQLESEPSLKGMMANITQTRSNLFSSTVVFISQEVQQQITASIAAIERVAALPGYQGQALTRADASAQHDFGPLGACMGYDFHLSVNGPQLRPVACCSMWRWRDRKKPVALRWIGPSHPAPGATP
jgi:hypothetical protein